LPNFPYSGIAAHILKNSHQTPPQQTVEQQALSLLERGGGSTVESLFGKLKSKTPTLTEAEFTDLLWRLSEENRVELEDTPPATKTIREYLRLWDRNLWFYGAVSTALVTTVAIYTLPTDLPLVAVRWVLGAVFVLFVPGYVTVEALFPKGRELDGIERFALSVGLSLALVPLIGLLLNYTPWGIRLTPIVISLVVFTIGVACVGVARRFKVAAERFELENLPVPS
jgi:hypothetical protein